jgi:hypothetical protein
MPHWTVFLDESGDTELLDDAMGVFPGEDQLIAVDCA